MIFECKKCGHEFSLSAGTLLLRNAPCPECSGPTLVKGLGSLRKIPGI